MSKLFQLLSRIEAKELPQLEAFLNTPYFNTKTTLIQLYRELIPYHPDFKSIDKFSLLKDFRPEKRKQLPFVNEQFSGLRRLIEQFLVQQELKQNKALQNQLQLYAFRHRQMPDHFNKVAQKIIHQLEPGSPMHWEDTQYLWLTYHNLHNYFEAAEQAPDEIKKANYLEHLDEYFILVKLRHICNRLAQQAYYADSSRSKTIPFLKAIMDEVQNNYYSHPIIQLYGQLLQLQLLQEWDQDLFEQATTQFYRVYPQLETGERYFLLLNLVNLANQQMTKTQPDLIHSIFRLFKHAVAKQLFRDNKQLTSSTFLNICTAGANVGELDWTTNFIKSHQQLLTDNELETVINLGKALFNFHSKQFDQAYEIIRYLKSRKFSRKLRIRTLTVRCLLELHLQNTTYFKVLHAEVSNFGQFINRSGQLSAEIKYAYRNFNLATMKIAELRQHHWGQQKEHENVAKTIQQLGPLVARRWLLSRVMVGLGN